MSERIFGIDPSTLIEEWREEGLEPKFGSIENDIMVTEWEDQENPVEAFKKEGLYKRYEEFVESCTLSGTFYRNLLEEDDRIIDYSVRVGDEIQYKQLTKWIPANQYHFHTEHADKLTLKLVCKDSKGVTTKSCATLATCTLTVVSKTKNVVTVRI